MGLDAVDQRTTDLSGVDQIHTGLIQRYRVVGGQNADVVHVWFGRIAVTVAVHAEAVHQIDVKDIAVQVVYHRLPRLGHGF